MSSSVQVGSEMGPSYGYAGFWWRVMASIIDMVVIGLVSAVATPIFIIFGPLVAAAPIIVAAGYSILLESSQAQGTVGKMICRLKVADLQGQRLTPGKAAIRYVGKYVSALLLMIGYLLVFFTSKKQGLHDLMAGTVVVKVTEHNQYADPIAGFHQQQEEQRQQMNAGQIPPAGTDPSAPQPTPTAPPPAPSDDGNKPAGA